VSSGKLTKIVVGLSVILGGAFQPGFAQEDILRVSMNHARVLRLDRPVSKVIVGNSKVADATVADPPRTVLTGRSSGTTISYFSTPKGIQSSMSGFSSPLMKAIRSVFSARRSEPFFPARPIVSSIRKTVATRTPNLNKAWSASNPNDRAAVFDAVKA